MSGPSAPVALVTGGGRRIGAGIARRLAGAGFSVVVTYRNSRDAAEALARAIRGRAVRLDLARPGPFEALAARVAREFGRLDLLVHNAAVFPRTPLESLGAGDFDAVFAVNLRAPLLLTLKLLPLLRRSPGRPAVVFLGDSGAKRLWPSFIPYCLSKIAVERLAGALRGSLAPGIRVGLVRPGLALRPERFPRGAWEGLRARAGTARLDSPDKVSAAVLRFVRRGGYNLP